MTTPKIITIDGTEYVRKTDISAGPPTKYRIVVADRGWVFIGDTSASEDGSLMITNAKVIRVWGTDSARPGLGYIALHGPTEKTKLDNSGTVRIPSKSIIATFDTVAGKWA